MTWSTSFRLRQHTSREACGRSPSWAGSWGPCSVMPGVCSTAPSSHRPSGPLGRDGGHGARNDRRRDGGTHGLRADRQRPGRADGNRHVLGQVHADPAPRPDVEMAPRRACRNHHVCVRATRRTESERPGPRRHRRGRPRSRRPHPVPDLPRPVSPSAPARGGRRFVARAGRQAFEGAVAAAAARERPDVLPHGFRPAEQPVRVVRSARAGAILALDGQGLVRYAGAHGCRLVLRHSIGDFVPDGAALVEVYAAARPDADRRVRG